jgi:hypothetical protein
MRSGIVAIVLVVGAAFAAACTGLSGLSGGGDTPDAAGDASPIDAGAEASTSDGGSIDVACMAFAKASCDRRVACAPASIQTAFGGVSNCTARAAEACLAELTAPDVVSTAADVDRCAADITKQSCDELRDDTSPESCLLRGARAPGQACVSNEQCQTSLCGTLDSKGCGTCAVPAAAGADCGAGCANGLACASGKCAVRGGPNATCDAARPCGGALRCATDGTCQPYLGQGQTCSGASECDLLLGFVCATTTCTAISFVQPGTSCVSAGGAPIACAGGLCGPGPADGGPTCTAYANVGEACGSGPPPRVCHTLARCVAGECAYPNDALCTP